MSGSPRRTITYSLGRAIPDDAEAIARVQHAAFGWVAQHYGVEDLPPMREDAELLRGIFATHVFLKAVTREGAIVGSVRGRLDEVATVHVGRLVVDPDAWGNGIATALCVALEEAFPQARRFELFTADSADAPLHIYTKLGYRLFRSEEIPGADFKLVYLEKVMEQSGVVGGEGFEPPTPSV